MYGKPGTRDDWAREIAKYHRDQREARNARRVAACAAIGLGIFLLNVISNWPPVS